MVERDAMVMRDGPLASDGLPRGSETRVPAPVSGDLSGDGCVICRAWP